MFACTITRFHKDNANHSCLHREKERGSKERRYFSFFPATCSPLHPFPPQDISVGPRKIGFQEEVISSSKEVECPRGRVPNEVYVRNKSSSGKKTRGMASNKGVAVENLRPAGKTSSAKLFHNPPSDPHVLPTAKRLSVSQHFLSEGGGDHRPFSQVVSCPSLSICETRTMAANLALKKMADHVSLGMAGILRR